MTDVRVVGRLLGLKQYLLISKFDQNIEPLKRSQAIAVRVSTETDIDTVYKYYLFILKGSKTFMVDQFWFCSMEFPEKCSLKCT